MLASAPSTAVNGLKRPGHVNGLTPVRRLPLVAPGSRSTHAAPDSAPRGAVVAQGAKTAMLAAAAAVGAAVAIPAVSSFLHASAVFSLVTEAMIPVYFVMMTAPTSKVAKVVVESSLIPFVIGAAYVLLTFQASQAGLLAQLWNAVCEFPVTENFDKVADLFHEPLLTSLAWLHLLLLDFMMARAVLHDGLNNMVYTAHSVALCFMFGPLGLMSHLVTKAVVAFKRRIRGTSSAVVGM